MDDLIVEFLTESNESLTALDADLITLEQNPNDKNLLSRIFRVVHTVKGTCGFLGLPRLETVAHHAENVMGRFRDGDLLVTPAYVSLILESLDRVRYLLGELEANGKEPDGEDTELLEKLDAVFEGRDAGASAPVKAVAPPPPPPPVKKEEESEVGRVSLEELEAAFLAAPGPADMTPSPASVVAAPVMAEDKHDDHAAAKEVRETKESNVANQSLRVNVDVLENLMTMVSELVLTRNQLLQILRVQKDSDFTTPLQRLNHVVSDLQEGVMKTRMQPVGNAWAKLPRIIRDISIELGKKIDLEMRGQDTELDRQVLDMIKDPLTHMVRNSADHGVEAPAERIKAGKPETGRILLNAYHEGGHIIIEITDDGKGLPTEKIRKKIVSSGLATQAEADALTPQQIHQYIFRAGLSTADKVTSVSGRGVGMDVVKTNIEKIGGAIELKSVEGKGSTFNIKIPLTLAIVSALIVEAGGMRFAIPQLSVRELVMTSADSDNRIEMIKGTPVFRLRDHLLPLVSLRDVLKMPEREGGVRKNQYIVVTEVGAFMFGMIVDRVYDTEEIVVKPVARVLKDIQEFSGNTILGDGSVIMILDPGGVARTAAHVDTTEALNDRRKVSVENILKKTPLLLFAAGDRAPKAVPLELVSRLEEIKLENVEMANGQRVVQYRNQLMPLVPFHSGMTIGDAGRKPVVVFSEGDHSMGLIVDQIIDIMEEHIDVQIVGQGGLLGSTIIDGKATDVIDVAHFLGLAGLDWYQDHADIPFGADGGTNTSAARRVLLVDDSPFFRNMLAPLLSVAGYSVTTASNAVEALVLCESGEKFDVIVSDIEMPEMDGFAFAQKIKAGSGWQDTPMVALSSHATPEDIDRGYQAGFEIYVAKFDRETLLTALTQTLSGGQA
jgi:two-component system chemotaxis sensor kinase CheA